MLVRIRAGERGRSGRAAILRQERTSPARAGTRSSSHTPVSSPTRSAISPVSPSSTLYYQAGTAWRLNNGFAVDVAALGTQHKAIAQAGAWFMQGARACARRGPIFERRRLGRSRCRQAPRTGPVNLSFDLRRILSRDGRPLVPLPSYANSFDADRSDRRTARVGSYTQATGSVGLRLAGPICRCRLVPQGPPSAPRITRSDRMSAGRSSTRNQLQVIFEASAQKIPHRDVGLRRFPRPLQFRAVVDAQHGRSARPERPGSGPHRRRRAPSARSACQYSRQSARTAVSMSGGGFDRNIASSPVHAAGHSRGALREPPGRPAAQSRRAAGHPI